MVFVCCGGVKKQKRKKKKKQHMDNNKMSTSLSFFSSSSEMSSLGKRRTFGGGRKKNYHMSTLSSSSLSSSSSSSFHSNTCNNCGQTGHIFYQCTSPIVSYGILCYRVKSASTTTGSTSTGSSMSSVPSSYVLLVRPSSVSRGGGSTTALSATTTMVTSPVREYLMIRRRHTYGFIELLRGKYSSQQQAQLRLLIDEMTVSEKEKTLRSSYESLMNELWNALVPVEPAPPPPSLEDTPSSQEEDAEDVPLEEEVEVGEDVVMQEEKKEKEDEEEEKENDVGKRWQQGQQQQQKKQQRVEWRSSLSGGGGGGRGKMGVGVKDRDNTAAQKKFEELRSSGLLSRLIKESRTAWEEPEWEFPKGRRHDSRERDVECALREFQEETGYMSSTVDIVKNMAPIELNFVGSNYKSYQYKYFVGQMSWANSLQEGTPQISEVSAMKWMSQRECVACLRPCQIETQRMIQRLDRSIPI